MSAPADRRGFLRGLASLPLIGGGVTLIGQPSAVAEPATPDILEAYKTWLHFEFRFLCWDMADDPSVLARYGGSLMQLVDSRNRAARSKEIGRHIAFVGDAGSFHGSPQDRSAASRAALVLSTVGCDWREDI